MNWILSKLAGKLREPSSWRGIFLLAGIMGYSVAPELQEYITGAVVSGLGIIEWVRKEKVNVVTGYERPPEVNGGAGQTINTDSPNRDSAVIDNP